MRKVTREFEIGELFCEVEIEGRKCGRVLEEKESLADSVEKA